MFEDWVTIRVTPKTLFKKKCYADLSHNDAWSQAVNDGWRFDMNRNKMYTCVQVNK